MSVSRKTPRSKRPAKQATLPKNLLISSLTALLVSLILVVISAFLLQKQVLSLDSVNVLNPVIKAVSALISSIIGVHDLSQRKFLVGGFCGLSYMLLTTAVFSLLAGEFSPNLSMLTDAGLCTLAGMVGGILQGLTK